MDKQKQIEDLTALIDSFNIRTIKQAKYVAEYIVDKLNYRKIPEGAVVLTREELERHKGFSREEVDEISETAIKNSRNEMAEKFAKLAKAKLNEWLEDNEDNDGKIDFGIAEIELIGVETLEGEVISESLIDEICKEITEGKNG